jgi:hypothetical protein
MSAIAGTSKRFRGDIDRSSSFNRDRTSYGEVTEIAVTYIDRSSIFNRDRT